MAIDWSAVISAENKIAARASRAHDAEQARAQQYLAETDWYVIRAADAGTPIPDTVRTRRAAARGLLSSANEIR